jgi:3-vinyl bacteriochlorophyllide hydratase
MGLPRPAQPLYTPDERRRRDASPWTTVQAVLAPTQFLVCLVSAALVIHYLVTGQGLTIATISVLCKTLLLYLIMLTGAIWEREVFGQYLFARPFFWEDAVSTVVIALHTAYVVGLLSGAVPPRPLFALALAGYATYAINAAQFLHKLRVARQGVAA